MNIAFFFIFFLCVCLRYWQYFCPWPSNSLHDEIARSFTVPAPSLVLAGSTDDPNTTNMDAGVACVYTVHSEIVVHTYLTSMLCWMLTCSHADFHPLSATMVDANTECNANKLINAKLQFKCGPFCHMKTDHFFLVDNSSHTCLQTLQSWKRSGYYHD